MKLSNQNKIRTALAKELFDYFVEKGEDCGMIASNSFNFPVVTDDGEEGMVEIVAKVTKDSGDDGYAKRDEYEMNLEEKARKAEEAMMRKEIKIAKDKKAREERKRKKSEGGE